MKDADVAQVAALFEEFRASEREAALAETKRTRLTFTHQLSPQGPHIGFETVVDQTIGRDELDGVLDGLAWAAKRQEAIFELEAHEHHLKLEEQNLGDMIHDNAAERLRLVAANDANAARTGRRGRGELTQQQQNALDAQKKAIETTKKNLENRRKTMRALCDRFGISTPSILPPPAEAAE